MSRGIGLSWVVCCRAGQPQAKSSHLFLYTLFEMVTDHVIVHGRWLKEKGSFLQAVFEQSNKAGASPLMRKYIIPSLKDSSQPARLCPQCNTPTGHIHPRAAASRSLILE